LYKISSITSFPHKNPQISIKPHERTQFPSYLAKPIFYNTFIQDIKTKQTIIKIYTPPNVYKPTLAKQRRRNDGSPKNLHNSTYMHHQCGKNHLNQHHPFVPGPWYYKTNLSKKTSHMLRIGPKSKQPKKTTLPTKKARLVISTPYAHPMR